MKKAILLLVAIFVLVFSVFALNKEGSEKEKAAIKQAGQDCIQGWYEGNARELRFTYNSDESGLPSKFLLGNTAENRSCYFDSLSAPGSTLSRPKKFSRGSMSVTGQIGIHSYVATDDPFNTMPVPLGVSYEVVIADNLGIGGTVMFDKWCDYLGIFGGKYTFRVFKPSLDITYHFDLTKMKGLSPHIGASLGYSILSVSNELGNEYIGELQSELYLAPFLGLHLYFWENLSGFFNRFLVTSRVYWSVTGDFSGLYGAVGITYKIK